MGARVFLAIVAAALFGCASAQADDLVAGLSTDLIQITSNFTGTDIVLFGAIEPTEEAGPAKDQDLVVVIRGPQIDMTVRRKARILGIWVNRVQTVLTGMPGYYFLASTRPLDDIASLATQQRFRLGTANLESGALGGMKPEEVAAFRAAAIRDRKREHLYWESPTGIEFLSRTSVPRPHCRFRPRCRRANTGRRSIFSRMEPWRARSLRPFSSTKAASSGGSTTMRIRHLSPMASRRC